MVFLQIPQDHCAPLELHLKQRGILMQGVYGARLVTHLDVRASDIEPVIAAMKDYFARNA
jgi:threonine aldolase